MRTRHRRSRKPKTESYMNDTPSPTPSPTPAPSPAPAPSPTPAPAPVAVARPEYLPEAYWDPQANSIKPEFGQHYNEVSTFHKTETERLAALAARKPEDIKFEIKLPETVKVPEGMDLKINPDDPRVPILRDLAIKNNLSQETVNALVTLDAQQQIAMHAAEQTRIAEEDKGLGANASARKDAAANYLKGQKDRGEIPAEMYERVKVYATDALTVQWLEIMMAKDRGFVPGSLGNDAPPKPAEVPMKDRWYSTSQKAS